MVQLSTKSPNKTEDYSGLRVTLTNELRWDWDDTGTGGTLVGQFWTPVAQGDLRPLGSAIFGDDYSSKDKKNAFLLVGNVPDQEVDGKAACAYPVDYEWVWDDHGSEGKYDATVWRPVAPEGYVALGHLACGNYDKPALDEMYCLRRDLTADGYYEDTAVYDDRGTGANTDLSCWRVLPQGTGTSGSEYIPIPAWLCVGTGGDFDQKPDETFARVPALYVPKQFDAWDAQTPKIEKGKVPTNGREYAGKEQAAVKLPFISFCKCNDPRSNNLIKDPFIRISRYCSYCVMGVWENGTTGSFKRTTTVKCGMSSAQSSEFSSTAGVSMTAEGGIEVGPFSGSISVSVSRQMTYSRAASQSEFQEKEVTEEFTVPPNTATVLFSRRLYYKTERSDGSGIIGDVAFNVKDDVRLGSCELE